MSSEKNLLNLYDQRELKIIKCTENKDLRIHSRKFLTPKGEKEFNSLINFKLKALLYRSSQKV